MYSEVFLMTIAFAFAEAKTVNMWFPVVMQNACTECFISHDIISQEIEEQTNDLLGGKLVQLQLVPD